MTKTKRKGLADRIRDQRKLPDKDRQKEKDLISVVSQDEKGDGKNEYGTKSVVQMPIGPCTGTGTGSRTGTCTGPCTGTVVQRASGTCTGTGTGSGTGPRTGPRTGTCTSTEAQWIGDRMQSNERVIFDPTKRPEDLTIDQFRVLHFVYFNRLFKIRSSKGLAIGDLINPAMSAPNVRNKLESLVNKGYIGKPSGINNGIFKGSTCTVNLEKCFLLFGESGLDEVGSVEHKNSGTVPSSYSSSSVLYKTTTTGAIDLSGPDLTFWVENGLTVDKIQKWMKEFKLSKEGIVNYLRWAGFDLVDNGKEKSIKEDAQSWFYGALKKGGYSKPVNFKSHEQKLIEMEKTEYEIRQAEIKELEKVRKQKQDLQVALEFERMMADPEGALYKQCFESFPGIQKKRYSTPSTQLGQSFEREMKRALLRIFNNGQE